MASPVPYASFHVADFGRGINDFLDTCSAVKSEFEEKDLQYLVCCIRDKLIEAIENTPLHSASHPFNRYMNPDEDDAKSISNLAHDLMPRFQTSRERSLLTSFFHSGGANREVLDEIIDQYFIYASGVLGLQSDCDDDDDDSEGTYDPNNTDNDD